MNMISWAILGLFFMMFTEPQINEEKIVKPEKTESENCSSPKVLEAFQDGEVLNYRVYYNLTALWMKAGEVSFKVKEKQLDNQSVFHAVAIGQTYPSYDWFFKVKDRYESYMSTASLAPLKFVRDVHEGSYKFNRSYKFDRSNGTAKATYTRGNHSKAKIIENIPNCTYDLLSSIYYARTVDVSGYAVGDTIPFSVIIDEKVYNLFIRYFGKEVKKTKLGKFRCLKIKPLLVEGSVFEQGENMTVWVTDDANRIPVRIEANILIGSIKADLATYAGLKHPFAATFRK